MYWNADSTKYSPRGAQGSQGETAQRNNRNATQGQPAPAPANVTHICSECGKQVTEITGKSGKPITAEQLAAMAVKNYGVVLCAECQAKRKAGQHE